MKLYIAVFAYADLCPGTVKALQAELEWVASKKVPVTVSFVSQDAILSRSRSKAFSDFMRGDADVIVTVDRDMEWATGDLLALADMAHLKKAPVAGFYCTRAKGGGYAGRLKAERAQVTIGRDCLHEAEFLPGGFAAHPRKALETVLEVGVDAARRLDSLKEPESPGVLSLAERVRFLHEQEIRECFYFDGTPFHYYCQPIVIRSPLVQGKYEALSEDWALSYRYARAGVPLYLWSKPVLAHWGEYPFLMGDAVQPLPPAMLVK